MRHCLRVWIAAAALAGTAGCPSGSAPPARRSEAGSKPETAPGQAGGALGRPGMPAPNRLSAETARALERAEQDRYWRYARETVDKQVMALLSQHREELQKGIRHDKLLRGDPTRKWMALTFDDGPHPDYTPRILAILKRYGVKSTFFVVGEMAEKYPELVKAELAAGHRVGNHTYHHVSLARVPPEYVATEIRACGEVLQSITGKAPRLFRPPGGDYNDPVAEVVEALGYELILWTDDPGDYASPGDRTILERTLAGTSNGAIILVHDGIQETVDVLPALLQQLRNRGYELVTIDRMLAGQRAPGRLGVTRRRRP